MRFVAGLFGHLPHGIALSVQNAVIAPCVGCALLPTKTVQGVRSGYAETTLSAVGASTNVLGTRTTGPMFDATSARMEAIRRVDPVKRCWRLRT